MKNIEGYKKLCKGKSGNILNEIFRQACSQGDIDLVKYILDMKYYDTGLYQLRYAGGFKVAKECGQKEVYNYLLTQLKKLDLLQISPLLESACKRGDIDFVKYVALEPGIDCGSVIHLSGKAFENACEYGHLDIIKFYLYSEELTNHCKLNTNNDQAFRLACYGNQLHVVKYFVESPDIQTKVNIHAASDEGFLTACTKNYIELYQYLIFEHRIEMTEDIDKYLKSSPEIKKLFIIRDFKDSLENKVDSINNNKTKKKNKL